MHAGGYSSRPAPGAALLEKGDLVAGKYRVERVIGQGGHGQVVSARHVELGNLFAIKVLRPEGDGSGVVRFMREAHAIARLQNEHVVRVHDVGQTDKGLAYMVMEHLDGQDLGALLAARGPLPVDEAVGALLEACDGLADAHAIGIVHRDLKPANLFLARRNVTGDATVKVVDFGLAKAVGSNTMGKGLNAKATFDGEIVGTGGYMAPEQLSGEATPRSDVWSLGVSLYKLLTGKAPFAGKNAVELSVAVLTAEMRPIHYFREDVPQRIEAVIARCLRKIPEERYADARALGDALLAAFTDEPAPQSLTAPTITRQRAGSAAQLAAQAHGPGQSQSHPPAQPGSNPHLAASHPHLAAAAARIDNEPTQRMEEGTKTIVIPRLDPSPPPSAFIVAEANLDKKTRMMLLGSGLALTTAVLFLLCAVAWRRSHQRPDAVAIEPSPSVTYVPATAAMPPPPAPVQIAAPVPTPAPTPVQVAAPVETAPAPAPTPEPLATAEPVVAPPVVAAPAAEPAPAVTAAAKPVAKKPKKALYDTP